MFSTAYVNIFIKSWPECVVSALKYPLISTPNCYFVLINIFGSWKFTCRSWTIGQPATDIEYRSSQSTLNDYNFHLISVGRLHIAFTHCFCFLVCWPAINVDYPFQPFSSDTIFIHYIILRVETRLSLYEYKYWLHISARKKNHSNYRCRCTHKWRPMYANPRKKNMGTLFLLHFCILNWHCGSPCHVSASVACLSYCSIIAR